MTNETKSADINEAFENIMLAEDIAEKAAYEEGFVIGKNQMIEGYHLGFHRSSSLAAQLGYYFGVLVYIHHSSNIPKVIEQSKKLIEDIQNFPVDNNDAVDIFDKFECIKLNFKKICSSTKIDATYPEANKLEF